MELILIVIIAFLLFSDKITILPPQTKPPELPVKPEKSEIQIIGDIVLPETKPLKTIFEETEPEKPPVIIPAIIAENFNLSVDAAMPDTPTQSMQPWQAPENSEFYPLLPWWTNHEKPYENWAFCDSYPDINPLDIPEFRRQRIQAFLLWLIVDKNLLPMSRREEITDWPGNTRKFEQRFVTLRNNASLKNWCIQNNTSLEREIWLFEKAGGFGPVNFDQLIPREIGYSARLPFDTHTEFAWNTGWLVFGIDYSRNTKALMAAFETDLIFENGNIKNALYGIAPIWQLYENNKKPLNPLYGRDLIAVNQTFDFERNYTPEDEQLGYLNILRKIPGAFQWSQNKNLFAVEYKSYQSSLQTFGQMEGHNAYFKLHFPNHWRIVAKHTPDVITTIIDEQNAYAKIVADQQQAIIDKYNANPSGISGDLALEIINAKNQWYALLVNTFGISWPNPNERILRFISAVVGVNQQLYLQQLKANNQRFWDKLLEWEKQNPFMPANKLVMHPEHGILTREWQTNTQWFNYRVPSSTYIAGRFYVDDPGNCYMYDNNGNQLYETVQYGRIVPKNELIKGKHGYYWIFTI